MKYIWFILFTVLTNAAAQLMLKQGMMAISPINITADTAIIRIFQIVFNPWVFAGLSMFVISMASHLFVLTKVDLSFAYPFLSLAYVAVAVFAYLLFGEEVNNWRIAGIAFICIGTVLIAQSGSKSNEVSNAGVGASVQEEAHSQHLSQDVQAGEAAYLAAKKEV